MEKLGYTLIKKEDYPIDGIGALIIANPVDIPAYFAELKEQLAKTTSSTSSSSSSSSGSSSTIAVPRAEKKEEKK